MLKYLVPLCAALAVSSCDSQGPAGPAGADGKDGTNGVDGTNGTNGMNGTNGADGSDGANGTDGADGADGANGADGAQGPQGPAGADFDAGVPMPLPVLGTLRMQSSTFSGSLPIVSYSLGLTHPGLSGTGGAGAGKPNFDDTIVRVPVANVGQLTAEFTRLQPFDEVAIDLPVADGGVETLTTMGTVFFSSLRSLGTVDAELGPLYELGFTPGQLEISWDGRTSAWDSINNTGTCGTGCGCMMGQPLGPYAQSVDWSWPAPVADARAWDFSQQSIAVFPTGSGGGATQLSASGADVSTPLTAQGVCAVYSMAAGFPFAAVNVDLLGAPVAPPQPSVEATYTACGTVLLSGLKISSRADGPAMALSIESSAYLYSTPAADGGVDVGGYRIDNNTRITQCP